MHSGWRCEYYGDYSLLILVLAWLSDDLVGLLYGLEMREVSYVFGRPMAMIAVAADFSCLRLRLVGLLAVDMAKASPLSMITSSLWLWIEIALLSTLVSISIV